LTALSETEVVGELAYQFEEGGDWLRAVKHLRTAADVAGRRFEPMQAAAILDHALELVRRLPDADRGSSELEILERLGAIYVTRFDSRAVPTYEAMIGRARHQGLIDLEVRGEFAMGLQLHRVSAELYRASLDRALERSAQQESSVRERTRRAYRLFRLFADWDAADAEELVRECAEVRENAEAIDLRSLMFYSLLHFYSARYREAIRLAKEAFDRTMRESGENPYYSDIFMMYQQMISPMYAFLGEWGRALHEAEANADAAMKNGNLAQAHGGARADLAWVHLLALDFDGAAEICASLLPFLQDPLLVGRKRHCRIIASLADIGRGKNDRALEDLAMLREEMSHHPLIQDRQSRMFMGWGLTEARIASNELELARAEGGAFLKVVLNNRDWQALAFDVNARVCMAQGNFGEARDHLDRALRLVKDYELPATHWRVHSTACDLQTRLGNREQAEVHRRLSRGTILKLADSLPSDQPLRKVFLSASLTRKVLGPS
jgi:tetratricopeptide (TPR) repeat protein